MVDLVEEIFFKRFVQRGTLLIEFILDRPCQMSDFLKLFQACGTLLEVVRDGSERFCGFLRQADLRKSDSVDRLAMHALAAIGVMEKEESVVETGSHGG